MRSNAGDLYEAVHGEEFADPKTELLSALKAMAVAVAGLERSGMDAASDLQTETLYYMADAVIEYLDRVGFTMERIRNEHDTADARHPPHAEAVP